MNTVFNDGYFFKIGSAIWVLGFIGGIVLGNSFPTLNLDDGLLNAQEEFNTTLMLLAWFSAFILGNFFMFFSNVAEYNRKSIVYLSKINNSKVDKVEKVSEWI